MEHHGEIPKQNVIAVVPARYASTRLPGKLLREIAGDPLIVHTLRRASEARSVRRVIAATDDARIFDAVRDNGFEAVMTGTDHESGSDRVAEVAESLPSGSIVVNVQGDEPVISPDTIDRAVKALFDDPEADIATACERISDPADILNPNVVKVVTGAAGRALYFSRAPIPFPRAQVTNSGSWEAEFAADPELCRIYRKHTGLYVYRREFLLRFAAMEKASLEQTEMLEQLRALENGATILVVEACGRSVGVDTAEDFERVKQMIEKRDNR